MGNKPASSAAPAFLDSGKPIATAISATPALFDKGKTRVKAIKAALDFFDNGKARVTAVRGNLFPEDVSRIVGDYLSGSEREYVVAALVGVQRITLCLSQDVYSPLSTYWSIGFLPPEYQWGSWNAQIDRQFPITDVERCLSFLDQTNSSDCRLAVEVLVVKLNLVGSGFPGVLDGLRKAINALQGRLSSLNHVVFSIAEYSSCCFTLKNALDKKTRLPAPVNHQQVLLQIIDDLETCWSANCRTLTPQGLLSFYFTSDVQRASETYLAKLVIPLNNDPNRKLFKDEAAKMLSTKIMCVCPLNSLGNFISFDQDTARLCHAIHFDLSTVKYPREQQFGVFMRDFFSFQDNRFLERIVINFEEFNLPVQLPRPSAPLKDATPRSALIELTLEDYVDVFHLKDLNNGYFPYLAHLSITGGEISGHLDSHRVPSLKTLKIGFGSQKKLSNFKGESCARERIQAIIDAVRPWQLVAAKSLRGWSLASYDDPTPNPQDDGKVDAAPSLPVIRELMLVMQTKKHADECQSRLSGNLYLKAVAGDMKDGLLVWAPDRVEKITAFNCFGGRPRLEFTEKIPGQTRILTSLTCYDIDIAIGDDVLPNLQSLELNSAGVTLSGAFPHLRRLSFQQGILQSKWEVNALLLEFLNCQSLKDGNNLLLRPETVPRLSYLRIEPYGENPSESPLISVYKSNLGLSHVKHVVFGNGMSQAHFFNDCQVYQVSHLELTVVTLPLLALWSNTVWKCETLKLSFYVSKMNNFCVEGIPVIELSSPLLRVKKLTVTEKNDCQVLLNAEMPELTDCTVPVPRSLGPNFKCPNLTRIRFAAKLSDIEKDLCLNPTTYEAIGAHPEWVYFENDGEVNSMSWEVAPSATGVFSFARP